MTTNQQYLLGFLLFVAANAAAQGLIPDTVIGKWVVLVTSSASLWLQRLGINTQPPEK